MTTMITIKTTIMMHNDGDDDNDACGGGSHDPVEWRRNLCTWLLLLL